MYCQFCGQALGEGAKFCPQCGKPMEPNAGQAPQAAPAKKKRRLWPAVAAAAAVLAVLAGGTALALHFLGQGEPDRALDSRPREKEDEPVYLLEEEIRYNADGTVFSRTAYEYDGDGRMTRQMEYYGDTLSNTIDYTYEQTPEGLLRLGSYSQSEGTARSEELLDEAGRAVESRYFNADGSCYSQSRMEYDDEGRILRWEQIGENGNIISGFCQSFDELGNMLTHQGYSGSRDQVYSSAEYIYTYGENGYPESADVHWGEGQISHAEFHHTFFQNGKPEWEELVTDNSEERKITTYNQNGQLLTMEYYDEDGELAQAVENVYDKAGNLLSQKLSGRDGFQAWYEYSYTTQK